MDHGNRQRRQRDGRIEVFDPRIVPPRDLTHKDGEERRTIEYNVIRRDAPNVNNGMGMGTWRPHPIYRLRLQVALRLQVRCP